MNNNLKFIFPKSYNFWNISSDLINSKSLNLLECGENLLILCFSCLFFTIGGWYSNTNLTGYSFLIALGLSLIYCYNKTKSISNLCFLFLIVLVSVILNGYIYDNSYDCSQYHYPISVLLAHGWNPLDLTSYSSINSTETPWVVPYPKVIEIIGANLFALTKNINSIKSINLIFFIITFIFSYDFLKHTLKTKWPLAITFVIMFNPVVGTQLFTGYIDQYIYYYLVISICILVKIGFKNERNDYFILYLITVLAIGTKLNAFFFQGLTLLFAVIWYGYLKKWKIVKLILFTGLFSLITSLFIFYHPYITNYLYFGNSFYPLIGENAIDIMSFNTPKLYLDHNRFYNFIQSLIYSWFSTDRGLFVTYDQRVCGFTIWMLPLLILSFLSLILKWDNWSKLSKYLFLIILLSCFIFEQTWWARYIPQLWLLPVIAMINTPIGSFPWKTSFLVLSCLTFIMSGLMSWRVSIYTTQNITSLLESIRGEKIITKNELSASDKYIFKSYELEWSYSDSIPQNKNLFLNQRIPFSLEKNK